MDYSCIHTRFQGTVNSEKTSIELTMFNPKNEYCGAVSAKIVDAAD